MHSRRACAYQLIAVTLLGLPMLMVAANAAPPAHAGHSGQVPPGQARHVNGYRQAPPGHRDDVTVDLFFTPHRRDIIRSYYLGLFNSGHCPPGLAKKHNGCMPPGQARKWRIGYRLPGDVAYHALPYALVTRLGADDPAYKLIRVGGDILRIAVGTGVVVDAVNDLGRLY